VKTITHQGTAVHYVKKYDRKELEMLQQELALNEAVMTELHHLAFHSKVETLDDGTIFLALRFPKKQGNRVTSAEIDFIIRDQDLAIVQYDTLPGFEEIVNGLGKSPEKTTHTGAHTLALILDLILESMFDQIDEIGSTVNHLEDQIFKGNEEKLLREISRYWRKALDFSRIVKPNAAIFTEFIETTKNKIGKDTLAFRVLAARYARLFDLAEDHADTLRVLHETNESLLTNKVNQVMKILTIFAVIVFPLTLISSIWGMNTQPVPFATHPLGFWIVLGIMGVGTLFMLVVFKLKRWL